MGSSRLLALALYSSALFAQARFRVDSRLVEIPVTVTDPLDRNVLNLTASNFRLFENSVEQRISSFSLTDTAISAGILFDTSGSMKHRLPESSAAIQQLFSTTVPEDEFFLVRFSDTPLLLTPFTRQPDELMRGLDLLRARGWTALYDAIVLSLAELRRASNPRRVLLVLSDGDDNNSRYTGSETLSRLREADVRVYGIGLFTHARGLERMTRETGGRMVTVHNLAELPGAVDRLSREMRTQYVLGYLPGDSQSDGRYRTVKVEVRVPAGSPPVRVSWRRGYLVPDY